jgi:hypothetical protein
MAPTNPVLDLADLARATFVRGSCEKHLMDLVKDPRGQPAPSEAERSAQRIEVPDHSARERIVGSLSLGQSEAMMAHANTFDSRAGNSFGPKEWPGQGGQKRTVAVKVPDRFLGARKIGSEGAWECWPP